MQGNIKALYYPDFHVDHRTLARAILLFDEIHFMDRPSITFGLKRRTQFGTIGAASPLRQFQKSFRENGVPFYVHEPYSDLRSHDWYEKVKADIGDPDFLGTLQKGLKASSAFRGLMISKGNYGEIGNEDDVLAAALSVDLDDLHKHGGATRLFEDDSVSHFDLLSPSGRAKHLVATAAICSAKMNYALDIGAQEGFSPLADAKPFGDLLATKYRRAARATQSTQARIQLTDLSFAVFDELLSRERLETLSLREAVDYRRRSNEARRAFMEHINTLHAKQAEIPPAADYQAEVRRIVETEIVPAARSYRNALKSIDENLVGSLAKGALGAWGGSSLIQLFGQMSLATMIPLAGAAAAYVASALIDNAIARRATKRECSLSYVLALE